VEWARGRGELKCNDSAWALWDEVYEDLSEGKAGLFGAVTSRAEAHVMRLALIYALLDGAVSIARTHLESALALWHYSEASARYIFGDAVGDPVADELLAALRNRPNGLTRTEISAVVFTHNRSAAEITRAIDFLCGRGLIRFERVETAGRPAERWFAARSTKETNEAMPVVGDEAEATSASTDAPEASTRSDGLTSSSSFTSSPGSANGAAEEEATWVG